MVPLEKLADSALYKRIVDSSLKATADVAAREATALLDTVGRDMPLYTLHNQRHILNLIGWIESLLGPAGVGNLSELECTLAILAAYTHDLGMTLTPQERATITADPAYLRHCSRFTEEASLIERLRSQGDIYRASLIESHLITDYVRATHAGQPEGRLASRLRDLLPNGLVFSRVDLTFRLELLALSHNHPVEWLRAQLERRQLPWHMSIAGQRLNLPFLGILLRLADILDFDSSRTPTILFRHLGLDRPLAERFSRISAGEWKKHLAITDTPVSADGQTVTYRADACPDPVTQKSIEHFIGVIKDELRRCTFELAQVGGADPDRGKLSIRLIDVKDSITPAIDHRGQRAYTYHDWSFQLDQEEIIRLLMGETLYGDPNLCIRELLQNSLDALELRDLRLQLQDKGASPFQPVDGIHTRRGFFKHQGPEQALAVTLSWGEQDGIQFLRVDDNGTGMTLQTIERYFTQIGKSFYKSPDFSAEQAEFRNHDLVSTPISQFGIGILSCFMIADRLSVRTNPGGGQPATDLEISGPGSLFWTRPGTRDRQGTEITLWLRSAHRLPTEHHREDVFIWLRTNFGYSEGIYPSRDQGHDPGFIAACYVVWPKYPVHIVPPRGSSWIINDRLHFEHLAPIDPEKFNAKLVEWDYPFRAGNEPQWEIYDWEDKESGTRLRIWHPVQPTKDLEWWEVRTFVEPQMRKKNRIPWLLPQGMFVFGIHNILDCLPCVGEVGCRVWIDLRGSLAPSLTADRGTARSLDVNAAMDVWQSLTSCSNCNKELFRRMTWDSRLQTCNWDSSAIASARHTLHTSESPVRQWRLAAAALATSIGLGRLLVREGSHNKFIHDLVRDPMDIFNHDFRHALDIDVVLSRTNARDDRIALHRAHSLVSKSDLIGDSDSDSVMTWISALSQVFDCELSVDAEITLHADFLQEAFFPDFARSWPPSGLQALDGKIGDAILTAPAAFRFELDGRRVLFGDPSGTLPQELSRYTYDLCFPMSAIPLGSLRRNLPAWRSNRNYRRLGILPFLLLNVAPLHSEYAEKLWAAFAPLESLYAFLPTRSLWYKPFAEWTGDDWQNPEHKSVFWNIHTGEVTRYEGVRDRPRPD